MAVGTHFHLQHGTKTMLVFLLADGSISFLVATFKFGLLSIRPHSATRKHLLLYVEGLRRPKKDMN